MLLVLCALSWLVEGSSSSITRHGNSPAAYGQDALCGCTTSTSTGALQVTWQRRLRNESIENLATFSQRFGQQVNEPHRGKVVFREASLNSTFITLRNVTWGDEGCYICSFNVYPDGSKRKEICLKVEGISKVSTSHHLSSRRDGEEKLCVFSCSATGKPAPSVDWEVSALTGASIQHQSETTTVENGDKTFTSSRNITLRVPADWSGHVDCLLNNDMIGQRKERIPFHHDQGEDKGKQQSRSHAAVAVTSVTLITVIVAAVGVLLMRKRSERNMKNDSTVEQASST